MGQDREPRLELVIIVRMNVIEWFLTMIAANLIASLHLQTYSDFSFTDFTWMELSLQWRIVAGACFLFSALNVKNSCGV
jgi:hypothetical protein